MFGHSNSTGSSEPGDQTIGPIMEPMIGEKGSIGAGGHYRDAPVTIGCAGRIRAVGVRFGCSSCGTDTRSFEVADIRDAEPNDVVLDALLDCACPG